MGDTYETATNARTPAECYCGRLWLVEPYAGEEMSRPSRAPNTGYPLPRAAALGWYASPL